EFFGARKDGEGALAGHHRDAGGNAAHGQARHSSTSRSCGASSPRKQGNTGQLPDKSLSSSAVPTFSGPVRRFCCAVSYDFPRTSYGAGYGGVTDFLLGPDRMPSKDSFQIVGTALVLHNVVHRGNNIFVLR